MLKVKNIMKHNKRKNVIITIILIFFWISVISVFAINYNEIEYYCNKAVWICSRFNIIEVSKQEADLYIKQTYGHHYQMTSYKVITTPPTTTWFRNFQYVIVNFEDIDHIEDDIIIYAEGTEMIYDSRKGGWLK